MILNEEFLREEAGKMYDVKTFSMLQENQKYDINVHYDLFISHSFMDKELVEVLYRKFVEAGYKVYIDWKEKKLQNRENVSAETAKILKTNMNNCLGLAYIATENITSSKWCPWELGYVDGKKDRAAILPIFEEKCYEFKGLEYLGIYPYIDYEKSETSGKYEFWVNDTENENKYYTLRKWLKFGTLNKQ